MELELRNLRYFVAVAETLNFSQAAQRLNISQPPLSLAIKQLETTMGTRLFERNSRKVLLTQAGLILYKEALFILSHTGSLKNRILQGGQSSSLRIGFVGSMIYRGMPQLLDPLRRPYENLEIELVESNSGDIVDGVATGKFDLGFIHSNRLPADLHQHTIFSEPFLLAAHVDNRVLKDGKAKQPALTAFKDEPFIFFSRHVSPVYYEILLSMCISAGFFPKAVHETRHWLSILSLVSQDMGVSIVPDCMKHCGLPNLRFIEFEHTQRSITSVIWSEKKEDYVKMAAVDRIKVFYQNGHGRQSECADEE